MKISFRIEGGVGFFPGLAMASELDTDDLPRDEADRLIALVDTVRHSQATAGPAEPPVGAADYQTYVVSVDDGDPSTFSIIELSTDEPERALIDLLNRHRNQRPGRPG